MNLKNINFIDIFKKAFFPIAFIFPLVLSMGVCSNAGAFWGCLATVVLSLFIKKSEEKNLMPVLLNFSIISFLLIKFGYLSAVIALIVSGIIFCFGFKFYKYIEKLSDSTFISGVMLATALVVTVLQTTNYFGIGATGNTAREMIESYISLGFHGNWRGVLYGTIVLVVMITYPRKFKKTSKIIHGSFIALIICVILNLFLNPPDLITSINEISTLQINKNYNLNLSIHGAIFSVACGIIISISNIFIIKNEKPNNKTFIKNGIANIFLAPILCFVPQKFDKSAIKNIPFAALTALIIFFFKDLIIRIPVHSCAVILIVYAWQAVKWKRLKEVFKNPISVLLFLLPISIFLLF